MDTPLSLAQAVVSSEAQAQRRAIAKAITLLESTRADHRAQADALLTALLPHTGKSMRLGISGVPGVGKSTFIEALGLYLIAQGHRVAHKTTYDLSNHWDLPLSGRQRRTALTR